MKFRLMAIWKFPYRAATIFRFAIRETRLNYHLIPRFGLFSCRLRSRLPNLDIGTLTYELPYLTTENLERCNLRLQPIVGHVSRQTKHRSWRGVNGLRRLNGLFVARPVHGLRSPFRM